MSESARSKPPPRSATAIAVSAGAVLAAALWWRRHPSACPYGQRFWVEAPHPFITRRRLLEVLDPRPGERLLEVGPGTGYYSLALAQAAAPGGSLAILDIQEKMLAHVMRRARRRAIANIEPRQGDARELPYETGGFDAACMIAALGEVPDPRRALAELARVLRPGGRLVIGELFGDPHVVRYRSLRQMADAAGLAAESKVGRVGYFARFVKPAA